MALAHIRSGAIVKQFTNPNKIQLEAGGFVHSPEAGFENGNDKVVPIVVEQVDTSTGADVVRDQTKTVETDRVLITVTTRDKTAQEITDEDELQLDRQFPKDVANIVLVLVNRVRKLENPGSNDITMKQLRAYIKGLR